MNKKKLIIGIIAIVGGLVFASLAFLPQNTTREAAAESWDYLNSGVGKEVQGKVAAVESDAIAEGTRGTRHIGTVYCPVYHYTVAEKEYEVQAVGNNCKEDKNEVKIGSTAMILYDPGQPAESFVKTAETAAFYGDTSDTKWIAIAAGGALMILLGIGAIVNARPKSSKKLPSK